MALNTPKRVRMLSSFASSPPPSNNGESPLLGSPQQWAVAADATGSYRVFSHSLGGTSGSLASGGGVVPMTGSHWMDGSLSPVSPCESPEVGSVHGSQMNMQHLQQQFQKSSATIISPTTGHPSHLATPPTHQQLQLLQQQNEARENNRRGRPRSEALTSLMIEGSTSPSAIKCGFCNRVFPREKSLQAHLRTHTGERPYPCDYPGCNRAFTQSGQLKTHQRLHTGERPFMCSAPLCQQRFTHANRHCPDHPYDQLKRCDDVMVVAASEQNGEVLRWLEKYRMEKEDRTPTRKTPKRSSFKQKTNSGSTQIEFNNQENQLEYAQPDCGGFADSPSTPCNPYKSRKGLMAELDMNAGLGVSPVASKIKAIPKQIQWTEPLSQEEDSADEGAPAQSTFNPKKRWLREAWQDDLARPLDNAADAPATSMLTKATEITMAEQQISVAAPRYVNPNEMRPTVLMVASKDRAVPLHLELPPPLPPQHQPQQLPEQHSLQHQPQQLPAQHSLQHQLVSHDVQEEIFDISSPPSSFHYPNESTVYQAAPNGSPNPRKWLGAMALMQLATNKDTPSPSTAPFLTSDRQPVYNHLNNPPDHYTQTVLEQSYTHL